jgi:hypothetical protein
VIVTDESLIIQDSLSIVSNDLLVISSDSNQLRTKLNISPYYNIIDSIAIACMEITILAFGAIQATFANDTAVDHFVEIVKHFFQGLCHWNFKCPCKASK